MQGNTKKNKETKSGPFKAKGISITKGVASRSPASKSISIKVPECKQTSATKTSIGGSGPSGVAAKSKGAYKLKGSKEGKLSNGLSKNVSGGSVPACSRAKTAKTKVLMKKVKKLKMGKLSQGKSTEPNGKKVKMINSAITSQAKLSTRASSTSSSTTTSPVKLSSSSSVASRRDSWLYRCLDEYDHRGQSGSFEPFFLTETIVIKHSQSELDKLIDIDAALCDRTQIQWQQQAPPQTGSINSTSQAVPNGPSVVSAPPPKMSIGKKLATGGVNTFEHVPQFDKSNVEEKQTSPTADRKRRNDRRAERNRAPKPENLLVPGVGILERAQRATLTRLNQVITPAKQAKMTTLQEQNVIRKKPFLPPGYATIFSEPFNQLSTITDLLGLTGVGGIIKERFEQFGRPVGCVINVTYEAPLLQVSGIESYRIPVVDDQKEQLSMYFDEVLDKIRSFQSKGLATVVHCMAGVSRSASIVIAYLIRYHQKSLEEAFRHTKAARNFINPNIGFLEQLQHFESANLSADQCSPWRDHTIKQRTIRLPLFIITDYLVDYEHEFDPPDQ